MKTVVIIENEAVELEAMVSLFEQWQKEINILTAKEEKAAISIMSQHHVDLVVCDLALPKIDTLEGFSLLTHTFPYVPCIALSTDQGPSSAEAIRRGASHCLEKPIVAAELLQHAADLLDNDTSGTVKGIPIHSFLQMLESEEKTCTLQVNHEKDTGLLYISNGLLVDAETKNFVGEKAAHFILSWQETLVQLRYFNGQRKRQINKPLLSIIMEAFRLRSEKEKEQKDATPAKDHQLPLKHLSTLGKRIPLEIGSRVKLEFPHLDTRFESTMVGMLQDHYLILTNPQPLADMDEKVGLEQRVIIKYVHKGRVWMFKAQLLKTVEAPYQLLFFEYPAVIHFHELRQTKRSSIFIPCTFHVAEEPELYGTLIDLSTTGALCLIKHKAALPQPQIDITGGVSLRCLMPGIKEEQRLSGIVRNLAIDTNETRIGIEFKNLQSHLAETIGNFLYTVEGFIE
ncbi:MAG: response regulator [Proteobacteria bacterium]|nr:response regulator [Pseudomonadota bacterium]